MLFSDSTNLLGEENSTMRPKHSGRMRRDLVEMYKILWRLVRVDVFIIFPLVGISRIGSLSQSKKLTI